MCTYHHHFSTPAFAHIQLYTMYFDSTGGAIALLNYAETLQENWRSLSSH